MGSLGAIFHRSLPAGGSTAAFRAAAAQDHRCQMYPHCAGRTPAGRGQGFDQRTRIVRPGLRHLHPADSHRADSRGCLSEALSGGQESLGYRGHLAVLLLQFLLAQRTGPEQRPQRGRLGLVGHLGEMDRPASLSVVGRQEPPSGGHLQVGRRTYLRRAGRFVPAVAGAGLSAHSLRAGGAGSLSSPRSGKRGPTGQPADTPSGRRPPSPGSFLDFSGSCASGSANRSSC